MSAAMSEYRILEGHVLDYCEIARQRIRQDAPLLNVEVTPK